MITLSKLLLTLSIALAGCLPHTTYVPKSGKAAIGMKRGRLAIIKDGDVAERDRFEVVMACEPSVSALARTSRDNFKSAERNQSISGVFTALTVIFPLAPLIGLPWAIKAVNQDQTAHAAMVDAVNRHNDTPHCVRSAGPGSAIGANR